MINELRKGLSSFISAWKEINYKKALVWGISSSLYTGILLLSIGFISERMEDPLIGYLTKSILSSLITIPIFLFAYIIVTKNPTTYFKNNIIDFYIWLTPYVALSLISGLTMIFTGNIYLYYSVVGISIIYLLITIFSPYYFFDKKDVKDSLFLSSNIFFKNLYIIIPIVLNIIILLSIFQLLGYLTEFIVQHNINLALILTIITSLIKPILYMLPLFNILTVAVKIKNESVNNRKEIEKVGDII